jgi:hypothetical protein
LRPPSAGTSSPMLRKRLAIEDGPLSPSLFCNCGVSRGTARGLFATRGRVGYRTNQSRFISTRPGISHPADQGNRSSPVQHGPCGSNLPVYGAEQSNARNGRFIEPDQCDLACPVLLAKRFRFALAPNQIYISRRLVPQRGGSRSSRTRDGMRWTWMRF